MESSTAFHQTATMFASGQWFLELRRSCRYSACNCEHASPRRKLLSVDKAVKNAKPCLWMFGKFVTAAPLATSIRLCLPTESMHFSWFAQTPLRFSATARQEGMAMSLGCTRSNSCTTLVNIDAEMSSPQCRGSRWPS